MQGPIALATGPSASKAPLGLGLLEHLRDRRARKDVVELLKQQQPPIRGLSCLLGRTARLLDRTTRQHRGQIRLPKQPLQGAVVAFLVGPARGAAPVQLQIQLIAPHRQARLVGLKAGQIIPQQSMHLGGGLGLALPQLQLLEHLRRRATAVVSHPWQPESLRASGGGCPLQAVALHRHRISIGANGRGHEGLQLTAAAATPAEEAMGEGIGGIPKQLVGAEPIHPRGLGNRRKASAKAKGVGQPGQPMLKPGKYPPAKGLTLLKLAQERGTADQHAIALNPGAVDRLEAARLHGPLDAREQIWAIELQPGVESRGGVAEMEIWEALHQIQGRAEGPLGGLPGVGHGPQPGEIQVGMAQHMKAPLRPRAAGPQLLQGQLGLIQETKGILRIQGLQDHSTGDQGSVVMEGAAQTQLQIEGHTLPPAPG